VGRDLTERRALEQRLTRAQRLASVGTLAAGVAHEINNPLTYVIHHLDQLEGSLTGASTMPPERMARYARQAREGVERISRIVRDLMLFVRDPRGDDVLVDVGQALQAAVQIAEHQLRHRAQLQVELAELPQVLGAEGRLTQVFVNLLLNAAQAIPLGDAEHHCVRVEARVAVGGLRVWIRDTGPGIPLEVRELLFEPFVTTKMPGEGTGLGLWICHNIITSMGGRIDVESEPGRGTAMVIWLPAAPGLPAMEGDLVKGAGEPPSKGLRLLVVDDEPLIREILQEGLVGLGEVLAAGSGRQALELIAAQPDFDLILCDLMMPDVTGVELAQHLERSAPELARRMIFLTGGAFSEEARAFLEGRERLRKPVGLAEVIQAIEGRIGALGLYPRIPMDRALQES
jgi:CheY-like chemotaxis protein